MLLASPAQHNGDATVPLRYSGAMDSSDPPITAESTLNGILARYPSAGPIIFQSGRGFVARPGDLYAQFPDMSVQDFARLNGLDVDTLIRRLRAEVEAVDAARRRPAGQDDDTPSRRRYSHTLGYTSSHRAGEDGGGGSRRVVFVQSAHGPE